MRDHRQRDLWNQLKPIEHIKLSCILLREWSYLRGSLKRRETWTTNRSLLFAQLIWSGKSIKSILGQFCFIRLPPLRFDVVLVFLLLPVIFVCWHYFPCPISFNGCWQHVFAVESVISTHYSIPPRLSSKNSNMLDCDWGWVGSVPLTC